MTLRLWYPGAAAGVAITAANYLAQDGTPPSTVAAGANSYIRASQSALIPASDAGVAFYSVAGQQAVLRLPSAAAHDAGAVEFCHAMSAPTVTGQWTIFTGRYSGGMAFRVNISGSTSPKVTIINTAGATVATSAADFVFGQNNRFAVVYNRSTGSVAVRVFNGDSASPYLTVSVAGADLGTAQIVAHDIGYWVTPSGTATEMVYSRVRVNDGATAELGTASWPDRYVNGAIGGTGATTVNVPVPVGVTDGHLGFLVIQLDQGAAGVHTPPAGWTTLIDRLPSGNQNTAIYYRKRQAGDPTTITLSTTTPAIANSYAFWFKDVDAPDVVGTFGIRSASGATVTASAVTVAGARKVLTISGERSVAATATENGPPVSWTAGAQRLWFEGSQVINASSNINSLTVLERDVASAGSVAANTITYKDTSGNAWAVQVAMPLLAPGTPPAPTPTVDTFWSNSLEQNAIRCGFIVSNATSARLAISTSPDMTSSVYSSAVNPASGGWRSTRVTGLTAGTTYYAQMELDGVLVGDVIRVRTLTTARKSYTFLTSSCQNTGSNHVVFDQMATEDADFFVHQGDLHYADTTDVATWRTAFLSSMNAARFKAMRSKFVMDYVYDNHDWAGQGTDASAWPSTPNPMSMVKEMAGEYPLAGNLFKTWVHGRVRFVHTDLWTERDSDTAAESSIKRAMSQAQEDLFLATLEAAKEPLIVWFAHWPLYTSTANGRWGSYTTQRNRIKAWLDARPGIRSRMIALGGDSHSVCADTGVNQNPFGAMPTLNASALDKSGGLAGGTWDIVNFDTVEGSGYYARCTVTDTGEDISFKWEGVDQAGIVVSTATYTRKHVTPGVWDGTSEIPGVAYVYDGVKEILATDIEVV